MATNKKSQAQRISKIQEKRKNFPEVAAIVEGILKGDKTALARAITLVESTKKEHLDKANAIIEQCLGVQTDSIRIGVTGVPGVGKSTFIEAFGKLLTSLGKKVAVLAVDPSSTQTKGSILGDKTRMQELIRDPNAYIRPSPSGKSLGGVTRKSRESIIICEAAGYNVILVETVGVGQSETAVHSMVDFFLLLKLPGAGDELQGIKRGIIEMADAIVINKADGDNEKLARNAAVEFSRALHLYPPKDNGWSPKVLLCSALKQNGLTEVWEMITTYLEESKNTRFFTMNRQLQNKNWLLQTLDDRLKEHFYSDKKTAAMLQLLINEVIDNKISPFNAAEKLLQMHHK